MWAHAHLITPSLILLGATITDLRSRKIYNWYFIASSIVALLSTLYILGLHGLVSAFAGAGVALLLTLPLVLARVMGAGDMKILIAFGLATSYNAVFYVVIAGFIWALVFGLIFIAVRGEFKKFLSNMKLFAFGLRPEGESLHRMPFTVGLLLGWIGYIASAKLGGPI